MPKVSVIVPVYNVENYLKKCIESVISQTLDDIELIAVDDGSSDRCGEICDEYAVTDSRIKVFHKSNGGVSSARNTGLEHITGEYVTFLDSDDWIEPEMLELMYKTAEQNSSDIVCCDYYKAVQTEDGRFERTQSHVWGDITEAKTLEGRDMYYTVFTRSATLSNKLIRTDLLTGLLFDTEMTYGEDSDYLLRVMERVSKLTVLPYCGYNYFINRNGNVESARIDTRSIELIENAKIIYKTLRDRGLSSLGVFRIYTVVFKVMWKIPVQDAFLRENVPYYKACRDAARYPAFSDICSFIADPAFEAKMKQLYAEFYFCPKLIKQFRAVKHKLKQSLFRE